MEQKVEPLQPFSAPDYDPDTDPVLARLRSHSTSGGGRRIVVAVAVVGLLAVGGWYAYNVYDSRSQEADEKEFRAQVQAEPAPPPVISPLQRAEEWCVENLAATEFAGLPVVEGANGGFLAIYTARAGDSIGSVVKRYGTSLGADSRGEILELAKREHVERYGGRGLWVGDEIRLLIPIEPRD
jgi:hypothetical protein